MYEHLFIRKTNGLFVKVDSHAIVYVEASGGCSKIVTTSGHHLVNSTLSQLEELLPAANFCRVNRSCIVGMVHIDSFTHESIFIADREIPLGKSYAAAFFQMVKMVF